MMMTAPPVVENLPLAHLGSESSSAEGLNIGTLLPETGALAFLSAPLLEGVNMAIADIGYAAGGVNGADVTLTLVTRNRS